MRTRLDLLLSEHVMIVAKESAAAGNHTDEYSAYTALLGTNSADLSSLLGRAFGSTAAAQVAQAWNTQNGLLVDYAIGVVTHNDDKAIAALSSLTNSFATQFAQVINSESGLPVEATRQLVVQQALDDKAFIDDVLAQKYPSYYTDLHAAYAQTARLGDTLATQIVRRFPDKFPGDPNVPAVDTRVSLNLLLQEHSYLLTMATDAVVAKRDAEKTAALTALASGSNKLAKVWVDWDSALVGYASSTDTSAGALTATFVDRVASATHADKPSVQNLITATIKVIDDQKAKSSKTLGGDDRAAATAMQPIADSLVQG